MAVQPDGKILVGGAFTMLGGGSTGLKPRDYLGRLNADGSFDDQLQSGRKRARRRMAVQPDGKILVGGNFTTFGGGDGTTPRNRIARLNADGSLDATFDPGANGYVYAMAVQPDGKILVGGLFTMLGGGGTARRRATGSAGSTPTARSTPASIRAPNDVVNTMAVQADGKILVGGMFTALGGGDRDDTAQPDRAVQRRRLARHQFQSGREHGTVTSP